ncbi:unnamed protein product [Anisakis simplex]|uniref:Cytochrome c (inferred by orthology to a human protein) n=1 Tax=Anisakis simplex TaxID=6269 RepID=A0A0M3J8R0_ANISI|nr:unnamed protein product [Anisakis simplex]
MKSDWSISESTYFNVCDIQNFTWTKEVMYDYLANPRKYLPGSKMIFAGLKKAQDRADVIKYMEVESTK